MTLYLGIGVFAFAILALVYVYLISPRTNQPADMEMLSCNYAHRGLWTKAIPENSLSAFEYAARRGVGIELDIQLTKDKSVVVFHDESLKRMCSADVKVSDLTYEELSAFTLGDSDERIPLLEEVLSLVDGKVPLLIELKGTGKDTSLCDKAFELLDLYGGAFCIESFNPLLIGYVKNKRPEFKRGQLVTILKKNDVDQPLAVRFLLSHMLLNMISRPHFIAYDSKKNPSFGIFVASSLLGAKKFAWTIRSFAEYKSLKEHGILSIFENFNPTEGD